jgi:dethiobiotin synthetase
MSLFSGSAGFNPMAAITYVTGTDTGVGKTVFTALLFCALSQRREKVRAIKPFSSGDRGDAELFWELQSRSLALDEINPFHFAAPIAPGVAARQNGMRIDLQQAISTVRKQANACDHLLVEGAGGLLSPLGEAFNLRDMIAQMPGNVIVVARNKLGVINHTLLTLEALQKISSPGAVVVFVVCGKHC